MYSVYADDASYLVEEKSRIAIQDKMKTNMEKITIFLNSNNLAVNQDKKNITEYMSKQKKTQTERTFSSPHG